MLRKNVKMLVKREHRRGRRNKAKSFSKNFRFLGVNAAVIRSKMLTFKKILKELKPSVFFIEETKLKDAGKIKLENYIIFERPRKNKINGGGVALGCINELNPVWVKEGENDAEALSVNIFVKN